MTSLRWWRLFFRSFPRARLVTMTAVLAYTLLLFAFGYLSANKFKSQNDTESTPSDAADDDTPVIVSPLGSTRVISVAKRDAKTLSRDWHRKYPDSVFKRVARTRYEYIQGAWTLPSDYYSVNFTHSPGFVNETSDLCSTDDRHPVVLFVFVESAVANQERRKHWREKWGSRQEWLRVAFVTGLSTSDNDNTKLFNENDLHNDIIVLNYSDEYKSLTVKTATMLQWIDENCAHAQFVLKTDDDVIVYFQGLRDYLDSIENKTTIKLYGGQSSSPTPLRVKNKWKISYNKYPFEKYPPYILGSGILMTMSTVQAFYNESKHIATFPFEDVFVGFCAKAADIRPTIIKSFRSFDGNKMDYKWIVQQFLSGKWTLAHGIKSDGFDPLWKEFKIQSSKKQ